MFLGSCSLDVPRDKQENGLSRLTDRASSTPWGVEDRPCSDRCVCVEEVVGLGVWVEKVSSPGPVSSGTSVPD